MREKVVAHVFLVVRGGLDVHQRARQFEKLHSRFFCPLFSARIFVNEAKRKEGPAKIARGCRLSIALHPVLRGRKAANIDGRQWTGLGPAPQPRASQLSRRFPRTTHPELLSTSSFEGRAPFARPSASDLTAAPPYRSP